MNHFRRLDIGTPSAAAGRTAEGGTRALLA